MWVRIPQSVPYSRENQYSIQSHKLDSVGATPTSAPICAIGVQWSAYRSSTPRVRVQVPYSTPNVRVMELAYIQVLETWFYGFDSRLGHHFSYSSALTFGQGGECHGLRWKEKEEQG